MSKQLDARSAHGRLRQALSALRKAEHNAIILFAEIMHRQLYRELGFASIHLYADEALGFSRSKTYEFIRLADSLGKLPELKASLESGALPWTKAREVVKVATPNTEKRSIKIAANNSRRELETQVNQSRARRDDQKLDRSQGSLLGSQEAANTSARTSALRSATAPPAAAAPQSLTLRMAPMQRARFDALIEKLMKRFKCSREETVLMAMEAMLTGGNESGPHEKSTRVDGGTPYQVHVYQCETCKASAVGKERSALSAPERKQIECDSAVHEPGERNRRSIPPSRRSAVLLRDGHCCRVRGCDRASFMAVHHLKARSKGGSNRVENLITLCSGCHHHSHERGGEVAPLREP